MVVNIPGHVRVNLSGELVMYVKEVFFKDTSVSVEVYS